MLLYGRGNAEAFDLIYARHKDAVYRYCLRQLPAAVVEDAHQEIWLALIRARQSYAARSRFKAWLFTLAHNTVLNRLRAEMKHASSDVDPQTPATTAEPEQILEKSHLSAILLQNISALPHHQRDALLLQQEGGFSIEDIAAITATSPEGVKSRLRYAMSKLRDRMQQNTLLDQEHAR